MKLYIGSRVEETFNSLNSGWQVSLYPAFFIISILFNIHIRKNIKHSITIYTLYHVPTQCVIWWSFKSHKILNKHNIGKCTTNLRWTLQSERFVLLWNQDLCYAAFKQQSVWIRGATFSSHWNQKYCYNNGCTHEHKQVPAYFHNAFKKYCCNTQGIYLY